MAYSRFIEPVKLEFVRVESKKRGGKALENGSCHGLSNVFGKKSFEKRNDVELLLEFYIHVYEAYVIEKRMICKKVERPDNSLIEKGLRGSTK